MKLRLACTNGRHCPNVDTQSLLAVPFLLIEKLFGTGSSQSACQSAVIP